MSDEDDLAGKSGGRWAAEEDTAMWDDSALKDQGFEALTKDRVAKPREETGPATARDVGGEDKSKVLTGTQNALKRSQPAAPASSGPSIVGWIVTIVLALGIGAAVFFLVRALK